MLANLTKPGVCGETENDCSVAFPEMLDVLGKVTPACKVALPLITAAGNVENAIVEVSVDDALIDDAPTNAQLLLTVPEPDIVDAPLLTIADVSVALALMDDD